MESPFNENLILSGTGCNDAVVSAIMTLAQRFACTSSPLTPGFRNEFHAGLQQAFGKHFVLSGEYIWKYTHNAYDFNVFGASPITFPIEWRNSKIPGFAVRGSLPELPRLDGVYRAVPRRRALLPADRQRNRAPAQPRACSASITTKSSTQTTHAQYQPFKRGPWLGFNWRYDSGLVSGAVPCLADTVTCQYSSTSLADAQSAMIPAGYIALMNNATGLPLTADQEYQAGITCNGVAATPTIPVGTLVNGHVPLPRFGARFHSAEDTRARHRKRRPQSAAHPAAEPVRRGARPRQPVPGRHATSGAFASPSSISRTRKRSTTTSPRSAARTTSRRAPSPPNSASTSRADRGAPKGRPTLGNPACVVIPNPAAFSARCR